MAIAVTAAMLQASEARAVMPSIPSAGVGVAGPTFTAVVTRAATTVSMSTAASVYDARCAFWHTSWS